MYFVYVLRSVKDGRRYIGYTNNIEIRIKVHNEGKVVSTKNRMPLELIYYEEFEIKKEAMQREKFLKSGKGREFLNSINK